MNESFPAYLISKVDDGQVAELTRLGEADLMPGDVTVKVEYSAVNYKDGLALTGRAPVVRKFPLVPGIYFAGTVSRSEHVRFQPGDRVVLNGFGVGEVHHGGFAGRARVSGDWLVPLPQRLSTRQAMAIGTAGYTAMLCVMALERHGITPDSGDILVTGAAGGSYWCSLGSVYSKDTLVLFGVFLDGHYWKEFFAGQFEARPAHPCVPDPEALLRERAERFIFRTACRPADFPRGTFGCSLTGEGKLRHSSDREDRWR